MNGLLFICLVHQGKDRHSFLNLEGCAVRMGESAALIT